MKRLALAILLGAVLMGVVGDTSARFSDATRGQAPGVQAGTVDVLPGAAHWYRRNDSFGSCDSSIHLLVHITNGGSLPLDFEVNTSVLGQLAGKVEVDVHASSDDLRMGDDRWIAVEVTLPCSADVDPGDRGTLKVTVVGRNAGFSDQEVWSSGFSSTVESDE